MNIYPHSPETNQPEGDARNVMSDEMVYRVDVLPINLPQPVWGLVGLNGGLIPTQYGPHPLIPGLLANTYRVERYGMQSLVRVKFSNNNQWRMPNPPPDKTDPGYSSWSMSSVDVITRVPVLSKVPKVVPLPSGATVTKNVWTVIEIELEETQAVSVWRGSLANFNPANGESLILAQSNTIHQIPVSGGFKRLFRGPEFNQTNARWEARYQWVLDTGTPRPADWTDTATRIYPPTVATIGATPYVRLPWQQFLVIPSANPETTPPTITVVNTKRENLSGWTTLPPGIPPP